MAFSLVMTGKSSAFTSTSSSYVDITGNTITISNETGGKYIARATINTRNTAGGNDCWMAMLDDGTIFDEERRESGSSSSSSEQETYFSQNIQGVGDLDGSVIKLQTKVTGSTIHFLTAGSMFSITEVF